MSCKQCTTSCKFTSYDSPRSVIARKGNVESTELSKEMGLEKVLENYLTFMDDVFNPMEDIEQMAIEEFIASKRKAKYLHDGTNLVKLRNPKTTVIKAVLGRAYYTRRLLKQRLNSGDGFSCGSKKVPAIMPAYDCDQLGPISDFVPCTGAKVPVIVQNICSEIEYRAKSGCQPDTYRRPGDEYDIRELQNRFLSGDTIPCVSGSLNLIRRLRTDSRITLFISLDR